MQHLLTKKIFFSYKEIPGDTSPVMFYTNELIEYLKKDDEIDDVENDLCHYLRFTLRNPGEITEYMYEQMPDYYRDIMKEFKMNRKNVDKYQRYFECPGIPWDILESSMNENKSDRTDSFIQYIIDNENGPDYITRRMYRNMPTSIQEILDEYFESASTSFAANDTMTDLNSISKKAQTNINDNIANNTEKNNDSDPKINLQQAFDDVQSNQNNEKILVNISDSPPLNDNVQQAYDDVQSIQKDDNTPVHIANSSPLENNFEQLNHDKLKEIFNIKITEDNIPPTNVMTENVDELLACNDSESNDDNNLINNTQTYTEDSNTTNNESNITDNKTMETIKHTETETTNDTGKKQLTDFKEKSYDESDFAEFSQAIINAAINGFNLRPDQRKHLDEQIPAMAEILVSQGRIPPKCDHDLVCAFYCCLTKDNGNEGKTFYGCPNTGDERCNFFRWHEKDKFNNSVIPEETEFDPYIIEQKMMNIVQATTPNSENDTELHPITDDELLATEYEFPIIRRKGYATTIQKPKRKMKKGETNDLIKICNLMKNKYEQAWLLVEYRSQERLWSLLNAVCDDNKKMVDEFLLLQDIDFRKVGYKYPI